MGADVKSFAITTETAAALAAHIRDEFPGDDELLADMLEGETDAAEWLDRLLDQEADDDAMSAALSARVKDMQDRKARIGRRKEARRALMLALLDAADLPKWERPLATVSITRRAPKPIITDESALPEGFWRVKREPDMAAIRAAHMPPPGTSFDNGGRTLTVRTK